MTLLLVLGLVVLAGFVVLVYPGSLFRAGAHQFALFAASQGAVYRRVLVSHRFARLFRWLTRPIYGEVIIDAVTIGHVVVFLTTGVDGLPDLQLERHELEHVLQAVRLEPRWWPAWLGRRAVGVLRHWLAYALEYLRRGYHDNRFEREARVAAHQEEP
jgi:hypothetical protein